MRLTAVSDSVTLLGTAFWTLLSLVRPRTSEPGKLPACGEFVGSAGPEGSPQEPGRAFGSRAEARTAKTELAWGTCCHPHPLCRRGPESHWGCCPWAWLSGVPLSSASGLQNPAISRSSSKFPIQTGRTGRCLGAADHVVDAGIQGHCQHREAGAAQPCLPCGTEQPLSR